MIIILIGYSNIICILSNFYISKTFISSVNCLLIWINLIVFFLSYSWDNYTVSFYKVIAIRMTILLAFYQSSVLWNQAFASKVVGLNWIESNILE